MSSPSELQPPRVFISYTASTPSERQWVRKLARDLRSNGVDALLDRWECKLGSDLPLFMESGIRDSARVLIICTPAYRKKASARDGGVGFESMVLTAQLASDIASDKFVCLLRDGEKQDSIPTFAWGRLFADFRNDAHYEQQFEELLRDLLDTPKDSRPALGSNPFASSQASIEFATTAQNKSAAKKKPPLGPNPFLSTTGVHFGTDVWNDPEDGDFLRQMKAVGRVYRQQHAHEKMHYREVLLVARVNRLAEEGEPGFGQPDEVLYELTFEAAEAPVGAMALTLSSPRGSDFFGKYELDFLRHEGPSLPFEALASISPDSPQERELIAFFADKLRPGDGQRVLELKDQGWDLMADLSDPKKRSDFLEIAPKRATESIGKVTLVIFVPDRISCIEVQGPEGITGGRMTNGELRKLFPPLGWRACGWQGRDVPTDVPFRATFYLPSV